MKIINQKPPIWNKAVAAFPEILKRKVIFAYGGCIYNPSGFVVTPALIAHEKIHCDRQGRSPDQWWDRYIADPAFRLDEELPAHIAEYEHMKTNYSRNQRRAALRIVATKLCSPLYGGLLKVHEAKKLIARGDLEVLKMSRGRLIFIDVDPALREMVSIVLDENTRSIMGAPVEMYAPPRPVVIDVAPIKRMIEPIIELPYVRSENPKTKRRVQSENIKAHRGQRYKGR